MKHVLLTATQLGQLLQSARKAAGHSQADLAALVDLSQSRLSKLEHKPGSITLEQLLALCASLGLELVLQQRGQPDGTGARAQPQPDTAGPEW